MIFRGCWGHDSGGRTLLTTLRSRSDYELESQRCSNLAAPESTPVKLELSEVGQETKIDQLTGAVRTCWTRRHRSSHVAARSCARMRLGAFVPIQHLVEVRWREVGAVGVRHGPTKCEPGSHSHSSYTL